MRRTAGLIALAVAVSGCRDRTLPSGDYALIGSEAGALPLRLNGGDNCFHMLKAGELTVIRGTRYRSTLHVEIACPGKGMQQRPLKSAGKLLVTTDSIAFQDTTGKIVGKGVLRRDSLTIVGPLHRLIYTRDN